MLANFSVQAFSIVNVIFHRNAPGSKTYLSKLTVSFFAAVLSDVRRKTERSIDFYQEAKIDEAFRLISQKPVPLTGRTEEVFVEDFRRELAEIKAPRRGFVSMAFK